MAQLIAGIRAPHEAMLSTELARTEGLLYRRGTFAGTLDDLICDAVLAQRDAEIAFSPGFRWGAYAVAGPADHLGRCLQRHRHHLSGRLSHRHERASHQGDPGRRGRQPVLPRSLLQQGGDMVRVGGMGFTVHVDARLGRADQQHAPAQVGGGRSRQARTTWLPAGPRSTRIPQGPPIWDVVAAHVKGRAVRAAAGGTDRQVRARRQLTAARLAGSAPRAYLNPARQFGGRN